MEPKAEEEATEDHSILCRPIQTGASAVKMIVNSLRNGTAEIRDLLLNECDVIFECKVCRSLHRSFVNFIAHKRTYCLKHLCESMQLFTDNFVEEETVVVQPEEVSEDAEITPETSIEETNGDEPADGKSEPEENVELTPEIKIENVGESAPTPRKLFSFQERKLTKRWHRVNPLNGDCDESTGTSRVSKFYQSCVDHVRTRKSRRVETRLQLRAIATNANAVYQTLSSAAEESRTSPGTPPTVNAQPAPVKSIGQSGFKKRCCVKCGKRFKTRYKLTIHVETVHSNTRTYYPCLLCKTQFSNIWSCLRHLMKSHNKTKQQAELLRAKIKPVVKTLEEQKPESNQQNQVQDPVAPVPAQPVISPVVSQPVVKLQNSVVFQCNICSKVFSHKPSLDGHRSSCLTKQRLAAAAALAAAKSQSDPDPSTTTDKEASVSPESPPRSTRPRRIVKKKMLDEGFVNSSQINIRTNSVNVPKKPEPSSRGGKSAPANHNTAQKFLAKLNSMVDAQRRQCLKCKQTFVTISNARRHAAGHIGYTRFRCRKCEFQAYGRSQIRCHILKAHVDERNRTMNQRELDQLIVSLDKGAEGEESEEDNDEDRAEAKKAEEENRKRGVLAAQADSSPVEDYAGEEESEGEGEPEVAVGSAFAGEWRVNLSSESVVRCSDISETGSSSPIYIFEFAEEKADEPKYSFEINRKFKKEKLEIEELDNFELEGKNVKRVDFDEVNGEPEVSVKQETNGGVDETPKFCSEISGFVNGELADEEAEDGERYRPASYFEDHNYFACGPSGAVVDLAPDSPVKRTRRGHTEQEELLNAVGSIIK